MLHSLGQLFHELNLIVFCLGNKTTKMQELHNVECNVALQMGRSNALIQDDLSCWHQIIRATDCLFSRIQSVLQTLTQTQQLTTCSL